MAALPILGTFGRFFANWALAMLGPHWPPWEISWEIIRMGAPAVPLILRELNEGRDGHWFQALRTLTGENPMSKDSTYDACRAAWLAWGRKRG